MKKTVAIPMGEGKDGREKIRNAGVTLATLGNELTIADVKFGSRASKLGVERGFKIVELKLPNPDATVAELGVHSGRAGRRAGVVPAGAEEATGASEGVNAYPVGFTRRCGNIVPRSRCSSQSRERLGEYSAQCDYPDNDCLDGHRSPEAVALSLVLARSRRGGGARGVPHFFPTFKGWLEGVVEWAEGIMKAYPVAGSVVFFLLSAISAMLAFASSMLLVPPANEVWGKPVTFLLLWGGWTLGAVGAYFIGYFARPLLYRLVKRQTLEEYQKSSRSG